MIYLTIFLLNVADLLTTHLAVNVYRVATEANSLMAPIIANLWLIVPLKLGGAFLMCCLLYRARTKYPRWRLAKAVGRGVLVFYTLVVINNSLVLIFG